jgi:hypothetical protein
MPFAPQSTGLKGGAASRWRSAGWTCDFVIFLSLGD